jgi:hypothetical protein
VLRELDVFAVEIHLRVLVLSRTVERFVRSGVEALRYALRARRRGFFGEQRFAAAVRESHVAIRQRNSRDDLGRFQHYIAIALLHLEGRR